MRIANRFGLLGCIVGIVALGFAALPMWILPMIFPPPPTSGVIADTILDIKDRMVARARGIEHPQSRPRPPDDAAFWRQSCSVAATALGLVALALAVVSALRRETWRYPAIAAALGIGAIVFEVAIPLVFALVVVAFIIAVLQGFGL